MKLIYIQIAFSAMFLFDVGGSRVAGINPLFLFAIYPVAMFELLGLAKVYRWMRGRKE